MYTDVGVRNPKRLCIMRLRTFLRFRAYISAFCVKLLWFSVLEQLAKAMLSLACVMLLSKRRGQYPN